MKSRVQSGTKQARNEDVLRTSRGRGTKSVFFICIGIQIEIAEKIMKEIIAIIRPHQWQKTKARLLEEGFNAFTVHRVYGRGRQKGLQYLSKSKEVIEGICFLPKRMVTLFVPEEDVEKTVNLFI